MKGTNKSLSMTNSKINMFLFMYSTSDVKPAFLIHS